MLRAALGMAACGLRGRSEGGGAADRFPGPLIDAHVHFYDPARPAGVPWPPPTDRLLHRTVLPAEWERLAAPLGPAGAIAVEASPWVDDNQWLLDLAERHAAERLPGMLGIVGVVGNLPLGTEACGPLLARFAAQPRFRGVRVSGDRLQAGLADRLFTSHLAQLAAAGLTLDVNGGNALAAVHAAADRFPELAIVIDHLGNPRISVAGPTPDWQRAIERLARLENVFVKVSGLVEAAARDARQPPADPEDPALHEPFLAAVWEACGMRRLMFGSNWPVSDRGGSYATVAGIVLPFVRSKGPEAAAWFLAGTSRVAYRWA